MTSDNWGIQASYKFGNGHMLNVRGQDVNEFAKLLGEVEKGLERIVGVGDIVAAVHHAAPITAAPAAPPAPAATGWEGAPAPTAPPAAPAAVAGKMCPHGAMTPRSGVNARGPWNGFYCPLPKGDPNQCKPVFSR